MGVEDKRGGYRRRSVSRPEQCVENVRGAAEGELEDEREQQEAEDGGGEGGSSSSSRWWWYMGRRMCLR